MKNLLFGLIALFLVSNLSFGQNVITIDVAKSIGRSHNSYLTLGIQNTPQTILAMKDNFMKLQVDGVDDSVKNGIIDFFTKNSIAQQDEQIIGNLKSTNSVNLYKSTKNIVLNPISFSQVSKALDLKLVEASKLTGKEQEILFTFIETSRSSLSFWLPVSLGGQGGGGQYSTTSKINWGAVGYADGAGAVGTLLRTWYIASFGPLSWGAIVGAVGWGAAWSSGASLLYQYNIQ